MQEFLVQKFKKTGELHFESYVLAPDDVNAFNAFLVYHKLGDEDAKLVAALDFAEELQKRVAFFDAMFVSLLEHTRADGAVQTMLHQARAMMPDAVATGLRQGVPAPEKCAEPPPGEVADVTGNPIALPDSPRDLEEENPLTIAAARFEDPPVDVTGNPVAADEPFSLEDMVSSLNLPPNFFPLTDQEVETIEQAMLALDAGPLLSRGDFGPTVAAVFSRIRPGAIDSPELASHLSTAFYDDYAAQWNARNAVAGAMVAGEPEPEQGKSELTPEQRAQAEAFLARQPYPSFEAWLLSSPLNGTLEAAKALDAYQAARKAYDRTGGGTLEGNYPNPETSAGFSGLSEFAASQAGDPEAPVDVTGNPIAAPDALPAESTGTEKPHRFLAFDPWRLLRRFPNEWTEDQIANDYSKESESFAALSPSEQRTILAEFAATLADGVDPADVTRPQ